MSRRKATPEKQKPTPEPEQTEFPQMLGRGIMQTLLHILQPSPEVMPALAGVLDNPPLSIDPAFLENPPPPILEYKKLRKAPGDFLVNLDLVIAAKSDDDAKEMVDIICQTLRNKKQVKDHLVLSVDPEE